MEYPGSANFVNPQVLRWARESTRLDLKTASKAAGISNVQHLADAESGDASLTLRQLEVLAKTYRVSLPVFYLAEPPLEDPLPVDFRRTEKQPAASSHLIRILRETRERRDVAELLMGQLSKPIPPFPAVRDDGEIISFLKPIFCVTEWSSDLLTDGRAPDGAKALNTTKALIEATLPILVFEYAADPADLRGCSLYSEPLSLVILSSRDHPNARRFTLAHEVAHLLLRQSGLCSPLSDFSADVERRCNWIAGESILPSSEVSKTLTKGEDLDRVIAELSRRFAASSSASAVRLYQMNAMDSAELNSRLKLYAQSFAKQRQKLKESDGGPSYHMLQAIRLGPTFTSLVLNGISNELLSLSKAAGLLGVGASYAAFEGVRSKALTVYGR
jgi:Zn-dependent peptidase ImmA (M78 family)/transcriptional regulator with XRE-family HTH domain